MFHLPCKHTNTLCVRERVRVCVRACLQEREREEWECVGMYQRICWNITSLRLKGRKIIFWSKQTETKKAKQSDKAIMTTCLKKKEHVIKKREGHHGGARTKSSRRGRTIKSLNWSPEGAAVEFPIKTSISIAPHFSLSKWRRRNRRCFCIFSLPPGFFQLVLEPVISVLTSFLIGGWQSNWAWLLITINFCLSNAAKV